MTRLIPARLRWIRKEHFAPLVVFFIMGLSAVDSVAQTFYVRDHITLDAATLVEIGIWTQLPWSIKIFFGSIIDSFLLLGNNRRNYILLGSTFLALGQMLFWAFVSGHTVGILTEYQALLFSGLLSTVGIVFAQSTANTLAIELVDRESNELGLMQVATRLAVSVGSVVAAVLTGYVASHYTMSQIAIGKLFLPLTLAVVTIIALRSRGREVPKITPQWKALAVSLAFALFCVITRSQVAVFLAQMVVINYLLWQLSRSMALPVAKTFLLSCAAIFLFRTSPDVGPGFSWWMMGSLDNGGLAFDETFFGHLRLVSTAVDILALSALASIMAKGRILQSLTWLTVIGTLTSIPAIAVYYGLEKLVGLTAHQVFFVDTAIAAPLADLSMIPLGILIARAAPESNRAMYMAITASFMNMALLGGDLMTKGLNTVWNVTRTNYTQLGDLLLAATGIGLALSVVGLGILYYIDRNKSKETGT